MARAKRILLVLPGLYLTSGFCALVAWVLLGAPAHTLELPFAVEPTTTDALVNALAVGLRPFLWTGGWLIVPLFCASFAVACHTNPWPVIRIRRKESAADSSTGSPSVEASSELQARFLFFARLSSMGSTSSPFSDSDRDGPAPPVRHGCRACRRDPRPY